MSIHVVNKGKEGEREVVRELNALLEKVLQSQQWPEHLVEISRKCIQRNQNQTAVGGCDLSNTFGLAIEIKRQEVLSIESWWRQCLASAERNSEWPVLLYRQNHKSWKCVTFVNLQLPGERHMSKVRAELSWEAFKAWFYGWVYYKLVAGEVPRI